MEAAGWQEMEVGEEAECDERMGEAMVEVGAGGVEGGAKKMPDD